MQGIYRRVVATWLPIIAGLLLCPASWAAEGKDVATVVVRNTGAAAARGVPVTFGHAFSKGDVPPGMLVHCLVDDRWAQVDAKRRHDDRSLRFAVVSAFVKTLPAAGERTLRLHAGGPLPGAPMPPVVLADLLATGFDAVVTLTFPDGTVRSASARTLLEKAGDRPPTWLRGHVCTEWLVDGPPASPDGTPDPDLHVRFQVRAYAGARRVRVSVAVENCWDTWAGNIRYDVAVAVGGKTVFAQRQVDHRRLSRWRKVFWLGGQPTGHVMHDLAYLSATGALPHYDRSITPAAPDWQIKRILAMAGPDWEIMGRGPLTAYMPTTGGRPEIAPYPAWAVRYLLNKAPRERQAVLAAGDLAGSWPIHIRARKTGRILTIDERPQFWLDPRGKDRPHWQPDRHPADPKQTKLTPDLAHQGSFAYIPYLLTGDRYYLDEACFWAGFCLLNTWPHPRQGAKGILAGQIRGNAWALRNLADAAWIAPDGAPEGKYLDAKVRSNIAHRIGRMTAPPAANPLGFWGLRTTRDARIQRPANPRWMIIAPWEHDYLMWSLHHLVELGYADAAKPRDFLLRWRVGAVTHAPAFNPLLATPYRMAVGEKGADGKVVFYTDWAKLGTENARLSKPGLGHYGNSYTYSARAAVICGVDGGVPQAREALRWLDRHLPNRRDVMGKDPSWAILPGGAAARPTGEF